MKLKSWLQCAIVAMCSSSFAVAYVQTLSSADANRQVCSGMYGGSDAYINVTFDAKSEGDLAMVIYEWNDSTYLGKVVPGDNNLPQRIFVCTSDALDKGYCGPETLGDFIINLPNGISIEQTSIWSRRLILPYHSNSTTTSKDSSVAVDNGFWDNPAGNPSVDPTDSEYTSPWRKRSPIYDENSPTNTTGGDFHIMEDTPTVTAKGTTTNTTTASSVGSTLHYVEPIIYKVKKTGFYCVAAVPLTEAKITSRAASSDAGVSISDHAVYHSVVLFKNIFKGELAAAEYPKIDFYLGLTLTYLALGGLWGYLCFRHLADLLPIQYYISYLLGFLVIEMLANWAYYRFSNARGPGVSTTVLLIVVTILDAGRNALSFFLLLVVCLGLSVVRDSLGPVMKRAKILTGLHFVFGVLYAIGLVQLDLESTAGLLLLMFVIPLAFTLSAFLLWIMHGLTGTITELRQRKQRYKLRMFRRLQLILIAAVIVIAAFFVLSSMSFSSRSDADFAPNSWRWRWWLIDGYLALLYLAIFVATAYLWRPTGSNRRLAMSDELAQDEEDAEDYDLDALESRGQPHPLNADGIPEAPRSAGRRRVGEDDTVFEIGEEEDDDDGRRTGRTPTSRKARSSGDEHRDEHEEEGLMSTRQQEHQH
ncbi:hypothetical protein FRC14_002359 [Serendipita sp. 396]|nr:hypothetical protein FRC14_002359 [Serendipita sp. 396]KAG8788647.1 hypothetical protein FRC15_003171 [Serendipita sp. 397]KAG8803945.1 hypothetical protein FRC16_002059 [Serendipita sp. 398]KAG8875224.1 hypothetical protein FRC20_004149 [Serendipita sp. 405]KAG9058373.1 hypothetical protein FS842_010099 [Serendipita sp. 407]